MKQTISGQFGKVVQKRLFRYEQVECRLQELLDIKETIQNREEYYKYDVRINRITNKIKEVTLDVLPKELMQNMIFNSK